MRYPSFPGIMEEVPFLAPEFKDTTALLLNAP
jgi:hypothetical protein